MNLADPCCRSQGDKSVTALDAQITRFRIFHELLNAVACSPIVKMQMVAKGVVHVEEKDLDPGLRFLFLCQANSLINNWSSGS